MPLPVYAAEADVPEADKADFAEYEGKWRHVESIDAAKAKKKQAEMLTELEAERIAKKDAETAAADAKRLADAKKAGATDEQLAQIRADFERDKLTPVAAERDTWKTKYFKVAKSDKLRSLALSADVGMLADRLDDDAMDALDKWFQLSDAGELQVLDAPNGKVTAESPTQFLQTKYKAKKEWLYAGPGTSGSDSRNPTRVAGQAPANPGSQSESRAFAAGFL